MLNENFISEWLKKAKTEKGVPNHRIAKVVYAEPSAVAYWVNGYAKPSRTSLGLLLDYFGYELRINSENVRPEDLCNFLYNKIRLKRGNIMNISNGCGVPRETLYNFTRDIISWKVFVKVVNYLGYNVEFVKK